MLYYHFLILKIPFILLRAKSFFEDNDGNAVSLKRVSQIINKEVPFVFADCNNEKQLEAVFEEVCILFDFD